MKISDRQLAFVGLGVALLALVHGFVSVKQNKEILSQSQDIKNKLNI